jgi:hypothetical protein
MPVRPIDSATLARFGFEKLIPKRLDPGFFLFDVHELETAVVEHDELDGYLALGDRQEVAHQDRQSPVAADRDRLTSGIGKCGSDRVWHRICH